MSNTPFTQADVSAGMQLQVRGLAGDLHISGHDDSTLRIDGDEPVQQYVREDGDRLTVNGYPGDLRIALPRLAAVEINGVGGDAQIEDVTHLHINSVGGDVQIEGECLSVEIGQIGGDLKLDRTGYLSLKAVGGDADLAHVERLNDLGHIGGDLRLEWDGQTEGGIRGMVGGDVELRLPDTLDLTLIAIVGGDLQGSGNGWNVQRGSGRQQLVFGGGGSQLSLTVGGDLSITGGSEVQQPGGGSGDWQEVRGSMDAFGEEMRGLGRELESLGRNLAHELSGLGRDIAREVRVAGREARRGMHEGSGPSGGRGPRVRVRLNEREFNLDPEQIERLKREARNAAASGIARAQEAVEQALHQWQQGFGAPARPSAPRPPEPPRPPQVGYTGQTVRIDRETDDVGSAQASAPTQAAPPARDLDAERLAILRMVHEGRLAPDEAELLLRGLEDRS